GIRPRAGRACRRTPVPGNLREVYIDLGARPARARVCHLPEVIALAESVDARVRQARELPPEIACIRIRVVDRGTQMLRIQPQFLGDELPGKANRIALEVVTEGKVDEHLEERVVASCKIGRVY